MYKRQTKQLLSLISDFDPETGFTGAFNIREDTGCAGRQNSQNIEISSKSDKPGIDIRVKPGTKGETVYIPACVTHSKVDDLVYNDFYLSLIHIFTRSAVQFQDGDPPDQQHHV